MGDSLFDSIAASKQTPSSFFLSHNGREKSVPEASTHMRMPSRRDLSGRASTVTPQGRGGPVTVCRIPRCS